MQAYSLLMGDTHLICYLVPRLVQSHPRFSQRFCNGGLLLAGLLQHLSSSFDVQVSNPVGGKTGGEVIWNKLVGSEMASHTMVRNWHILHIHCLDLNQYLISHFLQMLY